MKNKKIGLITLILAAVIGVAVWLLRPKTKPIEINWNEGIDLKQSQKLEYGEESFDPLTLVSVENGTVSCEPKSIDCMELADTEVTYTFVDLKDEKTTEKVIFTVSDTKGPEISLKEENVTVESLDGYDLRENIKSVKDPVDGDLTFAETVPAETGDGWYTVEKTGEIVKVHAVDKHGNEADAYYNLTEEPEQEEKTEEDETSSEETVTDDGSTSVMSYYPDVEIVPGLDWVTMSDGDKWYYDECTYVSGQYQTLEEAVADVVAYKQSQGVTQDITYDIRRFRVQAMNGALRYYQAGIK